MKAKSRVVKEFEGGEGKIEGGKGKIEGGKGKIEGGEGKIEGLTHAMTKKKHSLKSTHNYAEKKPRTSCLYPHNF